jgi:hypothetical protein
MNYELFEEKSTAAPRVYADENPEVLELSLDELSYVAGGWPSKYQGIV